MRSATAWLLSLPRQHIRPRPVWRGALLLALALAVWAGPGPWQPRPVVGQSGSPAGALPPGFTNTLVAGVASPTALAFTPDGRLLVTTQPGSLRVYQAGSLAFARTALDLTARVCANEERGLLGVAVDPDFAANGYIYLYYTHKKHGVCPSGEYANPNNPVNRVARFVLGDDNRVLTTTETVLVDNIPSVDGDHNGGDMRFGPDGYLYVSVGDNDCNYVHGQCGSANDAARDEFILLGKILRLTRDGGIPPGNPFQGADSDRCHLTGRTDPGRRCQETYAWGLRNPFRMAFDPNAPGTRFFINDVGQYSWEEIDEGQPGADYGWNCKQASYQNSTTGKCSPEPPNMVDPIYEYPHTSGCSAVTGGAFVPNGLWPAEFDGAYLFADYVCGKIFRLVPNSSGGYTAHDFVTGMGRNSAVSMTFGPYSAAQALYYTTYAGGGEVRRIAYTQQPVAAIGAAPTSGPLPLAVTFSGVGSYDPDGGLLAYDWNFGDGATLAAQASPTTTHTYTAPGTFTATLTVRDDEAQVSAPASLKIYAGNTPPAPSLTANDGAGAPVGALVTVAGAATDAEDGDLPASALAWEVRLHHVDEFNPGNAHWHPHHAESGVFATAFNMPAPEDLRATRLSYLEVRLTATDSQGLAATLSEVVEPNKVDAVFVTQPVGLQLMLNHEAFTAPVTHVLWTGWEMAVSAPLTQTDVHGRVWAFSHWQHGAPAAHTLTAPPENATYTAVYTLQSGPWLLWLPLLLR